MSESTEEKIKIVKADEVIQYLETVVMYLEACQQDMINNINKLKENTDNG